MTRNESNTRVYDFLAPFQGSLANTSLVFMARQAKSTQPVVQRVGRHLLDCVVMDQVLVFKFDALARFPGANITLQTDHHARFDTT